MIRRAEEETGRPGHGTARMSAMKSVGSALVFGAGLAAVVAVGWWLRTSEAEGEEPGAPPPFFLPVTLAQVELGDLTPRARITGTVSSARHARLGFDVAGRVRALAVREGEVVTAGTVLARLWDLDQQAGLKQAQAAAELARCELTAERAGARDEEVRRLVAELGARVAEAELAQSEVERNRDLVGTNVISRSRFDTLVAESAASVARVEAAQERLAEARAGSRMEDIAIKEAVVALREAEVGIADRECAKTHLFAPFGGSVVEQLVSEGDTIGAGVPVFELVDLTRREIELEIPSSVVPRLGARTPLRVTLDDRPGFELTSQLASLVVVADDESRNFRGLIRIGPSEDARGALMPGVFVRVELELEPLREVLLVPSDAVRVTTEGAIVVRALEGEPGPHGPTLVAELVPVRVLANDAGASAIETLGPPLAAGEQVVVTGVDIAFPGASLMPVAGAGPGGPPAAEHGP